MPKKNQIEKKEYVVSFNIDTVTTNGFMIDLFEKSLLLMIQVLVKYFIRFSQTNITFNLTVDDKNGEL